jgi:hypothetical protein
VADGELDITSPERLKAQKESKMKTYIVKDKTGLTGSMKEMFSAEELAHLASIMEANPVSPTDPEINRTARKIANTDYVGSSINTNTVSSRDLTDEVEYMEEMPSQHRSLARKLSMEKPRYYRPHDVPSKADQRATGEKGSAEYKGKITKLPPGKAKLKEDFEYEMARNELATAERAIDRLMKHLKGEGNLEAWVQSKITKASDYLDSVADYLESGKVNEETLEEGRGRPPKPGSAAWKRKNGSSSSEASDETTNQGRDPRQHIQVIAGQAAAGRQIDFKHNDGSTSKITPAMGRRINDHLNGLKPADRQNAVNKMHDSADGLKV